MKRILFLLITLLTFTAIQAQKISYIESTRSWNYVYDENGKKVYTFSTSQGQVVAYSDTFYILKIGHGITPVTPRARNCTPSR